MNIQERERLTSDLKAFSRELNMDLFGIAGLDAMNQNGKTGRRPSDLVPDAKALLVFGCGILDHYAKVWVSPQEVLQMPTSVILSVLFTWEQQLRTFLRKRGFSSAGYFEARGVFDIHLRQGHAFEQAGLGWVGKSNMAVSEKYGSRMNLLTLLTDAPLIYDEPYSGDSCGDCNVCIEFCTSTAIMGDGYYNGRVCEALVNSKPSNVYFSLSGWHDCDMCYRKCPKGEYRWTRDERRGTWWDIVDRNRENPISEKSIYLRKMAEQDGEVK